MAPHCTSCRTPAPASPHLLAPRPLRLGVPRLSLLLSELRLELSKASLRVAFSLLLLLRAVSVGVTTPSTPHPGTAGCGSGVVRVTCFSWVWFFSFVTVLEGVGRAPVRREEWCGHMAGLGQPLEPSVAQSRPLPLACPLRGCSRPPLRRLTGFRSELRNPGLSCKHLTAQGRGSALGWNCQRLPRLPGLAERPPHSSCTSWHGARPLPCRTRTLPGGRPSAGGSSALLEIIAPFLLLLLLLLQSPPQPGGGVPKASLPPSAQLCALRAPKRCRLQPVSERLRRGARPALAWSLMSLLLLLLLPFGLGLARGGRGEGRGGPQPPGMAPGPAGGSRFAPSHHLTSIEHLGAAVPLPAGRRGAPRAPRGRGTTRVQSQLPPGSLALPAGG
ncbi:uncharacterized protein LOC119144595 [Falco rusticolus]|uniref:uncharacterized protein LOC119144595 n=1 Tax=Falco rusticolus TaxID=120794 RepID=UPI000FFB56B8|nr:uncharacterized protein LOC119144595 [Falco rusticolus]